jgi:L-lysine 2,3-aminomutase
MQIRWRVPGWRARRGSRPARGGCLLRHRRAAGTPGANRPPSDPFGRHFIPDPGELQIAPHERGDPIGDDALSPLNGIADRSPERALLRPQLACPLYCFFFCSSEQVGPDGGLLLEEEVAPCYDSLRARPAIREMSLPAAAR